MNVTLRQMKAFTAVARHASFTAAAEALARVSHREGVGTAKLRPPCGSRSSPGATAASPRPPPPWLRCCAAPRPAGSPS